jgi:hypothetical protein
MLCDITPDFASSTALARLGSPPLDRAASWVSVEACLGGLSFWWLKVELVVGRGARVVRHGCEVSEMSNPTAETRELGEGEKLQLHARGTGDRQRLCMNATWRREGSMPGPSRVLRHTQTSRDSPWCVNAHDAVSVPTGEHY